MRRIVVVALLSVLSLSATSCGGGSESEIADYLEEVTDIMDDNMDSPADGIEELVEYVRDVLPDAMAAIGRAMVELDEIEDNGDRRRRAREMLAELKGPMKDLKKVAEAFGKKAEKDEDAKKAIRDLEDRFKSLEEVFDQFEKDLR